MYSEVRAVRNCVFGNGSLGVRKTRKSALSQCPVLLILDQGLKLEFKQRRSCITRARPAGFFRKDATLSGTVRVEARQA